jgi:hemolysin D
MVSTSHSTQPIADVAARTTRRVPRWTRPLPVAVRQPRIIQLKDCTALRQTIEAKPPLVAHAVAWLALALLVTAMAWAGMTRANLVVRTAGRVRPIDVPLQVFAPGGTKLDGRVAAVHVREGDEVPQGAVLLEFDTALLNNEIGKLDRTVQAHQEELVELDNVAQRLASQYQVARAKALAELAVGRTEVEQAQLRRVAEIRRAEVDLHAQRDQETRTSKLLPSRAVTEAQFVEVQAKARDSEQKLEIARMTVDVGKLTVLEQAVELAEQNYEVRRAELEARRVAKRGEIETASRELANLQLERERAVLRAPIDGIIVRGNPHANDLIQAGATVFEIARQQGFRFEVEVPSEDMGLLRTGMDAVVKFDSFDHQRYGTLTGKVTFLSPDSTPADANQIVRGATYLVKIDLAGDRLARGIYTGQIKLGMGGQAEIVTEQQSLLMILLRRVRGSISLS